MNPPAGVMATQPTTIAVAAPIAVTVRPRIASSKHRIDEDRPQRREEHERPESHALDDRAGHERRRDDAERRLEREEHEMGDRRARARLEADVVEQRVVQPAEDLAVSVERERVAD